MLLRKFSMSFSAIAILLTGSLFIFAQSAPVRGKVELKKTDGTVTPVVNAVIEVYRTDIKAKLPSAKTDKKGGFVFAGLPLGATMTFAVSGEGLKAEIYPGVKAGREDINITVYEGDGKALTEDEVRNALTTAPKQGQQTAEESAEAKKAREEYEKQLAEATSKNKKIEDTNKIVNDALKTGGEAYTAKNYDLAISKFDEGINADPDYAGSATVLNNNKALALRMRAFEAYKQGTTDTANKASWMEKAKNDFQNSIAASNKTLELIAKMSDAVEAKKFDKSKYDALSSRIEASRLLIATGADSSEASATAALTALEQYLAVETDQALKIKNQVFFANALRTKVNPDLAIPIYRKVLETEPNNPDAIGGLGLCLFNAGVSTANKEQMQDGLNYMQQFADNSPERPGDKDYTELKQSVKDAVIYLKEQEKLTPQKVKTTGPAPKKKP